MCLQHSQEKNKWLEVLVLLYRCCCLVAKLCLCNPVDLQDPPGSSVYGIFQQEYWSGWPFPFSGDLPDPEIKPASLSLLHCHVGYYHWATREALWLSYCFKKMKSHKDIPKHTRTYRIKPPWAFLQKPAWLWNLGNRQRKDGDAQRPHLSTEPSLNIYVYLIHVDMVTEGKRYTSDNVKITTKQFKSGPAMTAHTVH